MGHSGGQERAFYNFTADVVKLHCFLSQGTLSTSSTQASQTDPSEDNAPNIMVHLSSSTARGYNQTVV